MQSRDKRPTTLCQWIFDDLHHYRKEGGMTSPGFWVMFTYRIGHSARNRQFKLLRYPMLVIYRLLHFFVASATSASIPAGAIIGRGLILHRTAAIAIADDVVIGDYCTIFSGVNIAYRADGKNSGVAKIGNHVKIGAGAKVLGPIIIGDGAIIGANAVVLKNVPAGYTAVGVPAVLRPPKENAENASTEMTTSS